MVLAGGGTNRIVEAKLNVRQIHASAVLPPFDGHSEHLWHSVDDTLHTTIAIGVVRAGSHYADSKTGVSNHLGAVVGQRTQRPTPQRDKPVDEDVICAFFATLGGGNRVHIGTATETAREEQNVGVSTWRGWERAKVVDARRHTGGSQMATEGTK